MGKYNKYYKIVQKTDIDIGRCINCEARDLCGLIDRFECKCNFSQHYKFDITAERKEKLIKLNY